MGSGSNPAGEYECVDVRRSHRDGVEHADVSQFTERAEPVHRLGGYTEACSDPLYGEQRPHPSASCLWSCLLACPMPSPECLQDCGGIGGLARNPADIGLPRNLLRLRANRRIGVRRRPVSNFASRKFESRTPRHSKARDSLLNSEGDLGPPASGVTHCHSDVTALRLTKPEA